MYVIISMILAYLVGSMPTAYIFGKVLKGIDIREFGSGNVGATNVFRTVGKTPGLIVLFIDFLKGLVAVTVIPTFFIKPVFHVAVIPQYVFILLGAMAIGGHIWTVFLKFKGGKGVATTAGVMVGLAPVLFLGCFLIWLMVFSIWKYVSLASIVAAIALPLLAAVTGRALSFVIFCATLCMVGVFAHRDNLRRLLQGTEKQIKLR